MADVKLQAGQRVRLKPHGDQPEEWGVVIDLYRGDSTYLVELDRVFWDMAAGDDGLREVAPDQLTPCAGDELAAPGRCPCDLCRLVPCGHVAGKFDMECPECRMEVMP